jgi:hypothetical protein
MIKHVKILHSGDLETLPVEKTAIDLKANSQVWVFNRETGEVAKWDNFTTNFAGPSPVEWLTTTTNVIILVIELFEVTLTLVDMIVAWWKRLKETRKMTKEERKAFKSVEKAIKS